MSSSNNYILLQDTCALLDLMSLDLISPLATSCDGIFISDFVHREVLFEQQAIKLERHIEAGEISVDRNSDFTAIQTLSASYSGLSITDCSMIELSTRIDGVVVTTDKKLRSICAEKEIVVHGVIWIVELLLSEQQISRDVAIAKLRLYLAINRRAPVDLVEISIQRIESNL